MIMKRTDIIEMLHEADKIQSEMADSAYDNGGPYEEWMYFYWIKRIARDNIKETGENFNEKTQQKLIEDPIK